MTTEKKLEALKICNKITKSLITDEKVSLKEIRKLESLLGENSSEIAEPTVQVDTDMDNNLEKKITSYLRNFDIPANFKGYTYTRYALMYLCRIGFKSSRIISVTKDLYPAVAKEFGTTPSRVERAIRHAIEVSWNRCNNSEIKTKMFGNRSNIPTNSEFLYTIVDELLINS